MSSADRHARVMDLFDELCELDAAARVARLDEACADDPALRAEVLAHDETGVGALKAAGAGAGANLLAETIAGDAVPEQIGPYRVVREIGRGGRMCGRMPGGRWRICTGRSARKKKRLVSLRNQRSEWRRSYSSPRVPVLLLSFVSRFSSSSRLALTFFVRLWFSPPCASSTPYACSRRGLAAA